MTQHRQIVQMVNDLNRSLEEGRDDAELKRLFGALLAFTASHFATEEELMARHGYPQMDEHKTQHENLVHELQEITAEFSQGADCGCCSPSRIGCWGIFSTQTSHWASI
jgi:hemerythrin